VFQRNKRCSATGQRKYKEATLLFKYRINGIHRASNRSISQFTKVERLLTKQNAKFSGTITEINDEIIRLTELRISAEKGRQQNAGIIGRIAQIIGGDSV
jgi:hypothetical protein